MFDGKFPVNEFSDMSKKVIFLGKFGISSVSLFELIKKNCSDMHSMFRGNLPLISLLEMSRSVTFANVVLNQ